MPYDSNLDDQLFSESVDFEDTKISVSVYSYNNGPKKVQITRENKDTQGNFRFTKLGRMSKEEAEAVLPLITNAIASIQ